jgi:hypothetical protein
LGITAIEEQRLPDVTAKVALSVFSVSESDGYRESSLIQGVSKRALQL